MPRCCHRRSTALRTRLAVPWASVPDNAKSRLVGRERHVVGHDRLGEPLQGKLADFFKRRCLFDRDGNPLAETRICPSFASAQSRAARLHTVPIAV